VVGLRSGKTNRDSEAAGIKHDVPNHDSEKHSILAQKGVIVLCKQWSTSGSFVAVVFQNIDLTSHVGQDDD